MNKKLSHKTKLSVAVAAYKSESIIAQLIHSLIKQNRKSYSLVEIFIHCDNSGDKTMEVSKSIRNKCIKVVSPNQRIGFSGSFKNIISKATNSDILVILNDDIVIKDKNFLEKIAKEYIKTKNIGLVTGNLVPFRPNTFVERSVLSSFNPYKNMRYHINRGDNVFTCDGKILAITKEFRKKMRFPKNLSVMGNVDAYIYFEAKRLNYLYKNIRSLKAYFRLPSKINEVVSWFLRNHQTVFALQKQFGRDLIVSEYKPHTSLYYYKMKEFLKNPIETIFISIIVLYTKIVIHINNNSSFNPLWENLESTKRI